MQDAAVPGLRSCRIGRSGVTQAGRRPGARTLTLKMVISWLGEEGMSLYRPQRSAKSVGEKSEETAAPVQTCPDCADLTCGSHSGCAGRTGAGRVAQGVAQGLDGSHRGWTGRTVGRTGRRLM